MTAAQGFLEHGAANVALFDIDTEQGRRAVDELGTKFAGRKKDIIFRCADVTDGPQLDTLVHEVAQLFHGIDVLACFAGTVASVRAVDYAPETFRKIIDVNTTGSFLTAQAVGKYAALI